MKYAISRVTARRFVLGKAGLYPGRRWRGKEGAEQAVRANGSVQIDPVVVVNRMHDLILHARVADYFAEQLDELAYRERQFFDYSTTLFLYPLDELPYWRTVMRWWKSEPTYAEIARQHAAAVEAVRKALEERGPLGSRDLEGTARVNSYRARKDSGLALRYLWLTGEIMTYARRANTFDRIYYFTHAIVPNGFHHEVTLEEADAFFARKIFREMALVTFTEWARRFRLLVERRVSNDETKALMQRLIDAGEVTALAVEGRRETHYALTEDLPLIDALEGNVLPDAWQPVSATTREAVTFLAPLDMVSARGRAKTLFDFEYTWEIYKPADQRRWGHYTMPILYEDRLVGRIDPKLDRRTKTLLINGLWVEDTPLLKDADFINALGAGLVDFVRFHRAVVVDLDAVQPAALRRALAKYLKRAL